LNVGQDFIQILKNVAAVVEFDVELATLFLVQIDFGDEQLIVIVNRDDRRREHPVKDISITDEHTCV
jgi:hypothetical protein